jgi:hypothetical protein
LLLRERLVDELPANEADVTANIIVSASATRMIYSRSRQNYRSITTLAPPPAGG